ncbi:ABC transporter permease [Ectothiorhodospira lacustris]|uniref:ABC transporter permease n=1 Tax=Ectothiorhodospira lacustris TaxID=2899127 RepID=UPI001EE7DF53|nr:ABC transporter permease [Ectothiorhodospira lacustris]MCG5499594.1 ABC transporter permease [Ectothiorhodospira lacustris]
MTDTVPDKMLTPPARRSRSYGAQVAREVLLRWGARVGLAWIGILAAAAVFAPFLASSHPWLILEQGIWSSPVLRYLTATDVTLMAGFCTGLVLLFLSMSLSRKLLILSGVLVLSGGLSAFTVSPPKLVIYEQYREAEAAGQYDRVLRAPIPYSPKDYLRDFGDTGLESPLADERRRHWLGTEENGADVLSRMVHASRIALAIGFIATGIALVIGVIVGGLMGYFSGIVDMIGMRIVEIFEAIPTLFLLLTFVAFFGRSLYMMMIIIGITSWSGYARYVRAEFLKLREQDYVQAAVACGLPLRSVLFRHMLPNGVAPILVAASFGVASAILAEATLSFLGLGLVDDPSWGQMLNQAVQSSSFNWWMAAFPGGAIFLTVFAYNLVGESLRDALDPYLKKKA